MPSQADQVDRKRRLSLSSVDASRPNPVETKDQPSPISIGSTTSSPADSESEAREHLEPGYEALVGKLEQMYRDSRSQVREKKKEQRNVADYDRFQVEQVETQLYAYRHHHSKLKALLKTIKRSEAELDLTDVSAKDCEWDSESEEEDFSSEQD